MTSFKEFASSNKFVKLDEIGDSITLIVNVNPFELEPRESNFKNPDGTSKLVVDYVFKDPETGAERVFSNGSQSVARAMAKTKVGDLVRLIKIEKNGKAAYTVKVVGDVKQKVKMNEEDDTEFDPAKLPF